MIRVELNHIPLHPYPKLQIIVTKDKFGRSVDDLIVLSEYPHEMAKQIESCVNNLILKLYKE